MIGTYSPFQGRGPRFAVRSSHPGRQHVSTVPFVAIARCYGLRKGGKVDNRALFCEDISTFPVEDS